MSERASRRLAMVLAVVALAMETMGLVLLVPASALVTLEQFGFNGVAGIVFGAAYPVLGWLIASRQRANPIGWMFLVIGLSQAGEMFFSVYAVVGLLVTTDGAPLADLASWASLWCWAPGFTLVFVLPLMFPDGQLLSRRWLPVVWLAAIGCVLIVVPVAVGTWGYRGIALATQQGPSSPDALFDAGWTLSFIGSLLVYPVGIASVASLAARYRRSGSIVRQQLKWFLVAVAAEIAVVTASNFISLPHPAGVLAAAVVAPMVPIATAIAILRYRLYEIDRIVSRTVGWALVTALLVAVFVLVVIALQAILAGFTQGQTLAVAASTLVAFALFQPLRRRVQQTVDHRFDRTRYDANRVLAAFATEARDEVDLGRIRGSVVGTANAAVSPTGAAVWLRGDL